MRPIISPIENLLSGLYAADDCWLLGCDADDDWYEPSLYNAATSAVVRMRL